MKDEERLDYMIYRNERDVVRKKKPEDVKKDDAKKDDKEEGRSRIASGKGGRVSEQGDRQGRRRRRSVAAARRLRSEPRRTRLSVSCRVVAINPAAYAAGSPRLWTVPRPVNHPLRRQSLSGGSKPAPLLTQGVPPGIATLEALVKAYLKERYHKKGNVYLGIPHRLDRPVSGVVVFARNTKAARRLAEQFQTRQVRKIYWAVVERSVAGSVRMRRACGKIGC